MEQRTYLCIDLKAFYASVECVERGLNPLTTNLLVADPERSEKTICLVITPSMKALGIHSRCRIFQIPANVPYIMAQPRMKLYIKYSAHIYSIYLKYIAKEDIHVYSIDEAFIDVTNYLDLYHMEAKALAAAIMADIKDATGITATAGIGTNLYLAKVALDITAKHVKDNLSEREHVIVPKRILSEEQQEELNRKLHQIRPRDILTAEYFQNGEYIQVTGMVSRIDETSRVLKIVNTKIIFDDISDLQGENFIIM